MPETGHFASPPTEPDRALDKLRRLGTNALGDNELLALVVGTRVDEARALELANRVLREVGGVRGLARATPDDLGRLAGIGERRAAQVVAAVELGRRTLFIRPDPRTRFASSRELAAYLLPPFGARPVEQYGVVLLDARCAHLRTTLLSVGTVDASLVHPRDIFRAAALAQASGVVVFHNHPSGDPAPSEADIGLTARLCAAAALMGVELVDHIILADSRYYSFRDMGGLTT